MCKMLKMKKFLCEYESTVISFDRSWPGTPGLLEQIPRSPPPPQKNKQLVVTIRLYSISMSVISHGVIVHAVKENCGTEMAGYIWTLAFSAPRSVAELLYFAAIYYK